MRTIALFGFVALGPVLAVLTFLEFGHIDTPVSAPSLRIILTADLIYLLLIAGLIARRVAEAVAARRAKSAGSRLHTRLTGVFALVALAPTILVALFAVATINFGLESWFSERVQSVVGNSLEAAEAYQSEHREDLRVDAAVLANYINRNKDRYPFIDPADLRELLSTGQQQMQRELSEAYIIDGGGALRARGVLSYLFDYEQPSESDLRIARAGQIVILEDWENNEFRALVHLTSFVDRYLYVTREVDGQILELLDETRATVTLYEELEGERGGLLFRFALIYIGFAVIVILGAIWLAFWFADRLARPVARLAGAAQRVGAGDLDVRVREEEGDDEIAMLSRVFNRMTSQVKRQRDALIVARNESDRRRRVFEAVLSGVSAGVIGLDETGRIDVINDAARGLLTLGDEDYTGRMLDEVQPEFAALMAGLGDGKVAQQQLQITTQKRAEDLLIRITRHKVDEDHFGYVVTFDSITDLMSAQRMAAWGDVARRIAHEIKNPLTPIQLSAERMKRKYAKQIDEGRDGFEQIADVIVRQTNDLRRIVDEFSKFARMPEPEKKPEDICALIRDAVLLRQDGAPDIRFETDLPDAPVILRLDRGQIGQAIGNLLKNAAEAVEAQEADGPSEVHLALTRDPYVTRITITDTGIGLPDGGAARLFEPYVTSREKGTGLGLAIVKKIIEDHDGTLDLRNSDNGTGAVAEIVFPAALTAVPDITEETNEALHA
ncbi:two-component system nitrogen regulation sensor histidine kinase NtrY [Rubricella aquisinus]|uniref:histidine kinase n=1 Tax=Rubricella aquisinus TaxID=2028108 RepID=A0A840WI43_9RHOB|nr:two-component system nitrogen regulation sensor histidine kinase NtrY [Rubricella aquisinus]